MRGAVCLSVLCLLSRVAIAEPAEQSKADLAPQTTAPAGKSAKEILEIEERVAFWLRTCLQDWDAQTHMTRREWRATCERVAAERGRFLRENTDAIPMTIRSRQR